MTRARRGIIVTTLVTVLITAGASAAQAADSPTAPRSPVGNWRTSTNGVPQTVTFAPDGAVFGDSGCNRFSGTYTVKGSRMRISPLASTLMACPPDVMAAERTFLTRLQAAVSYAATRRVLKVFAPKDLIRFVRS